MPPLSGDVQDMWILPETRRLGFFSLLLLPGAAVRLCPLLPLLSEEMGLGWGLEPLGKDF